MYSFLHNGPRSNVAASPWHIAWEAVRCVEAIQSERWRVSVGMNLGLFLQRMRLVVRHIVAVANKATH